MVQRRNGILLSYLILGVDILIGLFYTPFLLSKIGESHYGIFVLSQSLLSFVTLLDFGLGQTLVRYKSKFIACKDNDKDYQLNGLFMLLYIGVGTLSILIGLILIVVYPSICKKSMTYEEISLFRYVFAILVINLAISFPMRVFSGTIRANERFTFLKSINLIALIGKYTAMFFLLIKGYDLISITLAIVGASVFTELSNLLFCFKKLHIKFDYKQFNNYEMKEIIWFSFIVFINLIIEFLFANTDKIILGAVSGTVAVSIYTIGVYFSTYFEQLSISISGVFMTKLSQLYDKDKDMHSINEVFLKVSDIQLIILFLFLGGYVCFGQDFISLWVGDDFHNSYIIGLLIMIPAIVPLSQNIGISILKIMNLHKYNAYMSLIIAALNVVISIPLAYRFQGIGCAIGTCFATVIGQILYMNWFYYSKVGLNIKKYWIIFSKRFTKVTAMSIFFLIAKHICTISSWKCFATYTLIYIIIYIAFEYKNSHLFFKTN